MGLVYEAEHLRLARNAALKILEPNLAADESFRERFVQESRLVAAIDHPNIIPIYDAGEVDGVLYIAMRLVRGYDLQNLVEREGALAPSRALPILEQAAAALDAAHARDLVHRDVKPANIMIDEPTGRTFLTDFGIAKPARTRATKTGLFVGTVDYAPPEQIEGKPTTAAADVYAFGCVLYECLTGKRAFDKETDVAVIYAHLREPPPQVSARRPDLPAAVDEVVARALAKNPGDRYASCGELVAASRAALGAPADVTPKPLPTQIVPVSPPLEQRAASNLPVPGTSLVGRERETAELTKLLRSDVRLVSVTGPGGAGKTRLAIEVGRELEDEFADGVFFVSLAGLGESSLVAGAIADVLDVMDEGAAESTETLVRRLQQRVRDARLLLILDNFEHLLPAASLVSELLAAGTRFRVLVTSQAALRLQSEHEFAVPPLELPPADVEDPVALARYPTVTLFVDRARAVRSDFALSGENARAVAELCARLDGLPLAIELAAARTKLLTPQAMLDRLEDRLALLTGGARDLPSRHQTLRNTIAWSYDLLAEPEQILFARLAVFEGGCTLEAIESVCAALPPIEPAAVLDGVESLVDKSLLRRRDGAAGETRLEMLQTIQEYARYQLIERGEVDDLRRAHGDHYVAVVEAAEPELFGREQAAWVERLDDETDNLWAALSWSLDGDVEIGLRIAGSLTRFWSVRGQMSEGRQWLAQALDRSSTVAARVRAKALFAAGYAALGQGDYADALRRFGESLELYRALDDPLGTAMSLAQQGWLLLVRGELERATEVSTESLALARNLDDRRTASTALSNLAEIAARRGELERAAELFGEALGLRRELGDRRNIANALLNLGRTELIRANDKRAAALLEEGLELASEVRDTWGISLALSSLARVGLRRGDDARAEELLGEALTWCRERGDKGAAAECLTGLAAVAAARGDEPRAARLWGAAETLRETMAVPVSPTEHAIYADHLAVIEHALGDAFEAERATGRGLGFEEAIRYARGRESLNPSA